LRRSSVNPSKATENEFRTILDGLRKKIPDVQAVILAGPNGVVECVLADPELDLDTIAAEYATLFRIAGRTSQDTGTGNLVEHIVVAERSIVIARSVSPGEHLILLCRSQDQIGRARYELRHAAWEIQRRAVSKSV
jgi:predicted regulator of Ras-like GTPase activity (Roadblock/LC7/MglB family)